MSNERSHKPKPADAWVSQWKRSANPHADPVLKLARTMWLDGGFDIWEMGHEDDPGAVHFGIPASVKKAHPYAKHSMVHTDRPCGGEDFTRAVEGGHVVSIWLKPEALMRSVPKGHAQEILGKRAEALAARLRDQLGIEPLEARVCLLPQSLVENTAGTKHALGAVIRLASTRANDPVLRTKVPTKLRVYAAEAERLAQADAKRKAPSLSRTAEEDMLAAHAVEIPDLDDPARGPLNVAVSDEWLPINEVGLHVAREPRLISRQENGKFVIPYTRGGKTHFLKLSDKDMGISPARNDVLILPLDAHFRMTPTPGGLKNPKHDPTYANAKKHDMLAVRAFSEAIEQEIEGLWDAKLNFGTPMGDFIALTVEHEKPQSKLLQVRNLIRLTRKQAHDADIQWKQYLEDRTIEYRPPGRE